MLGENTCYWDFFRYFRKWVVEDRFGPISIAEGEYLHYLPRTPGCPTARRMTPTEARAQGRADAEPTWRADQPPIQYLTHDLGPLLEVLDDRCVSVSCRSAPWRCEEAPLRSDGADRPFPDGAGRPDQDYGHAEHAPPGRAPLPPLRRRRRRGMVQLRALAPGASRVATRSAMAGRSCPSASAAGATTPARVTAAPTSSWPATSPQTILAGRPAPIDVYRGTEYTLPGILANRSAELGGAPVAIPDLRRQPFDHTAFWDTMPLPATDPPAARISAAERDTGSARITARHVLATP